MTPEELRLHRESLGMTQQEFADYLNYTRVHISRLETGDMAITKRTQRLIELLIKDRR